MGLIATKCIKVYKNCGRHHSVHNVMRCYKANCMVSSEFKLAHAMMPMPRQAGTVNHTPSGLSSRLYQTFLCPLPQISGYTHADTPQGAQELHPLPVG